MTDAAASSMILADLDETLRELLERELAQRGLVGVTISFDAPTRDRTAQWPSPAIDLFLYDLREAPARDRSLHPARADGRPVLVRAPLRLMCVYAITAWAPSALDEHRLLSQVIAILAAHPQLPVELLAASLLVGEPPQPLIGEVAHVPDGARPEFWTALGGSYKLSVVYTVTLLVDPGIAAPRGPAVRTEGVSIHQLGLQGGARDACYTVAGKVVDDSGDGLEAVAVSVPALGVACATDKHGGFVLRSLPPGTHVVQARAAGERACAELEVPGGEVVLTLPSGA